MYQKNQWKIALGTVIFNYMSYQEKRSWDKLQWNVGRKNQRNCGPPFVIVVGFVPFCYHIVNSLSNMKLHEVKTLLRWSEHQAITSEPKRHKATWQYLCKHGHILGSPKKEIEMVKGRVFKIRKSFIFSEIKTGLLSDGYWLRSKILLSLTYSHLTAPFITLIQTTFVSHITEPYESERCNCNLLLMSSKKETS